MGVFHVVSLDSCYPPGGGILLVLRTGFGGGSASKASRPTLLPEMAWAVPLIGTVLFWASNGGPYSPVPSGCLFLAEASLATGAAILVSLLACRRRLKRMSPDLWTEVEGLAGVPTVCAFARFTVWQGIVCTLVGWLGLEMPLVLTLLFVFFCAVALAAAYSKLSRAWYRSTWGSSVFNAPPSVFDLFLSYRSTNVSVARRMADELLASGVNVWFAEYFILLEDRDNWQRAVNKGIRSSDYGLVLTNNDWAKSEYTRHELVEMQNTYGVEAKKKIIEVKIPEELWECPTHVRNIRTSKRCV